MKSAIIAIAATLTITTLATAQNEPPGHKHTKSLDKLIGRWATRIPRGVLDPPTNRSKGTLQLECRYVADKSYILLETRFRPDNVREEKSRHIDFTVIGYSKEESTAKVWNFRRDSQESDAVEISDGKIVSRKQEGKLGEPDYRLKTVTTRLVNDNTLEYKSVIVKGTRTTEDATVTLKRIK